MQDDNRCRATYVHRMVRVKNPISCNVCGNTEIDDLWSVTTGPRCTACITLPAQRSNSDNVATVKK